MESIQPAPRKKSFLWKLTLWLFITVIAAECIWVLATIPFFRHTVKIETALISKESLRRKKLSSSIPIQSSKRASIGQETNLQGKINPLESAFIDTTQQIEQLNREAQEYRVLGDLALAHAKLKEAENLNPRDPATLMNLGNLLEQQNQMLEARAVWQRLYELGESAGSVFNIAQKKMGEFEERDRKMLAQQFQLARARLPQLLRFANVEKQESEANERQYRVTINAHAGETAILPADVRIQTFFFERDEEDIVPTSSKVNVQFESRPVDWIQGTETLTVRVGPLKAQGSSYYGYLMRIFYQGNLQDEVASPTLLATLYPAPIPQPEELTTPEYPEYEE